MGMQEVQYGSGRLQGMQCRLRREHRGAKGCTRIEERHGNCSGGYMGCVSVR